MGRGGLCVNCTLGPVSVVMDLAVRGSLVAEEKAVLTKWWREYPAVHEGEGLAGSWLKSCYLGSESRMTKWDAGKLVYGKKVKGEKIRF